MDCGSRLAGPSGGSRREQTRGGEFSLAQENPPGKGGFLVRTSPGSWPPGPPLVCGTCPPGFPAGGTHLTGSRHAAHTESGSSDRSLVRREAACDDQQLADLINYIDLTWNGWKVPIKAFAIGKIRNGLKDRKLPYTNEDLEAIGEEGTAEISTGLCGHSPGRPYVGTAPWQVE